MTIPSSPLAADALLGLLLPFWQLVIGITVIAVLLLGLHKLAVRGPSRMATAVAVSGAAALGLVLIGFVLATR